MRDCITVKSGKRKQDRPYIAKIGSIWKEEKGKSVFNCTETPQCIYSIYMYHFWIVSQAFVYRKCMVFYSCCIIPKYVVSSLVLCIKNPNCNVFMIVQYNFHWLAQYKHGFEIMLVILPIYSTASMEL